MRIHQSVRPGGVCVAGQRDEARSCFLGAGIESIARGREAVPRVEIERQTELAERDQLLDIADILRRLLFVGHGLIEIWRTHARHDNLVGEHLPGFTSVHRGF